MTDPHSSAAGRGDRRANRLAGEASPYLLQHAHNPVDWRPWGEEAFEEARRRDVPIFLSVGYSTCYWCHVMERESFESESIAAIMNERFVCIKVDREERPDVDEIYMAATVIMNGHGGWPMSVFLEPEKLRPFWCGTYFPAEASARTGNRPTFPQILMGISSAWKDQRKDVLAQAEQIAADVGQHLAAESRGRADVGAEQVSRAVSQLINMFDRVRGGFGQAPKFPQPVFLEYLLAVRPRATDDSTADAIDGAVRKTLDRMMTGGIHDQAGGGFHRYSVDAEWLVPHFEKMLYDNAQLLAVYAAAARYYSDNEYERAARRIVEYIDREMTRDDGAFYSAQDAEINGREGLNYLWTPDEVRAAVPAELVDFAIAAYGLDKGPNFQDPHHEDEPARNILRLADRPDRLARAMQVAPEVFRERLDAVNEALLAARAGRKQPGLDDKVITAWNAMMIAALAVAGRELGDATLTDRAERAMRAVLEHADGGADGEADSKANGLLRSHRGDRPGPRGFLEDHAWMIRAACELSRARGEPADGSGAWASKARDLATVTMRMFVAADGRPFDTREDDTTLFIRACSTHDGATPSGASVLLHALLDLFERTGDQAVSDSALAVMRWYSKAIAESPLGAVHATHALFRMLSGGIPGVDALGVERARDAAAPEAAMARSEQEPAVEIYAPEDRITLREGVPGELTVMVKVRDGLHVIAADPGEGEHASALTPFRVRIVGGGGVTAYADYPAGEDYGVEGVGKIRVYQGSFDLRIALERTGEWTGRPLLAISYQACSDTECQRPVTTELDIAIDRA